MLSCYQDCQFVNNVKKKPKKRHNVDLNLPVEFFLRVPLTYLSNYEFLKKKSSLVKINFFQIQTICFSIILLFISKQNGFCVNTSNSWLRLI